MKAPKNKRAHSDWLFTGPNLILYINSTLIDKSQQLSFMEPLLSFGFWTSNYSRGPVAFY